MGAPTPHCSGPPQAWETKRAPKTTRLKPLAAVPTTFRRPNNRFWNTTARLLNNNLQRFRIPPNTKCAIPQFSLQPRSTPRNPTIFLSTFIIVRTAIILLLTLAPPANNLLIRKNEALLKNPVPWLRRQFFFQTNAFRFQFPPTRAAQPFFFPDASICTHYAEVEPASFSQNHPNPTPKRRPKTTGQTKPANSLRPVAPPDNLVVAGSSTRPSSTLLGNRQVFFPTKPAGGRAPNLLWNFENHARQMQSGRGQTFAAPITPEIAPKTTASDV